MTDDYEMIVQTTAKRVDIMYSNCHLVQTEKQNTAFARCWERSLDILFNVGVFDKQSKLSPYAKMLGLAAANRLNMIGVKMVERWQNRVDGFNS